MGFSRPELNEDSIQWNRIQAQLESAEDHDPEEPLLVEGLNTTRTDNEDSDSDSEQEDYGKNREKRQPPRISRAKSTVPRPTLRPLPKVSSPEVAAERLPKIKAAAERIKRLKKNAIDPGKTHRVGKVVFDPSVQKFGKIVFSAPGYVRLEMRDGTASTVGKPPLDDRRNFVLANFDRLDNQTMAEILEISVHPMRRLCHEYGLKRHGRQAKELRKKSA